MLKRLAILILEIIFLTSMCGCAGDHSEDMSLNTESSEQNTAISNYQFEETSSEEYNPANKISISYPKILKTGYEKINDIILDYVEEIFSKEGVTNAEDYSIDLKYNVELFNNDYLSITFQGLWNLKSAAHPIDYFDSITIDIKNNKIVSLGDVLKIDNSLVDTVRIEFKKQIRKGLSQKLCMPLSEVPEEVENLLDDYDDYSLMSFIYESHFYLKDNLVYISVYLPHAIGDHFEIYIKDNYGTVL